MKTLFVNNLPKEIQQRIKQELVDLNLSTEDVNNAMNSRLCDLTDTLNTVRYTEWHYWRK